MGSLEEEELVQMVEDFIETESISTISLTSTPVIHFNHQSAYHTLQEILGSITISERVVLDDVLNYIRKAAVKSPSSLKKWLAMKLKRKGYDASFCKTSWITTSYCPGGDYEYIDVMQKDENGSIVRLILDIDFKSQFELARPTPSYKELSGTLPTIFVGSEEKLVTIISLLCKAAKQSLREKGLHIPPWRKTSYMQSKWLSECQKVSFNRDSKRENNSQVERSEHSFSKFSKWIPPEVKPKRSDMRGRSGLSSQLSQMSINCF